MVIKKLLAGFCFVLCLSMLLNANQITVVKQATAENPELLFEGISGNSTFSKYVLSDLKKCGWFNVVNSGNAKYSLSGTAQGSTADISVKGASSFRITVNINQADPAETADRIVDSVLKKIFGIPGICSSKIAFVAQSGKVKEIFICNFNGTGIKQITRYRNLALEPSWAMRNTILVFTLYRKNFTEDVVGYNFKNGKTYNLASFPGLNNSGAISPDGKYLAVILSKNKSVDLYIKQINSKRMRRVTKDNAVEGSPCWAPDSRQICFVSNLRFNRPELYIYNLVSGKAGRIKTVGSEALSPSWSPAGNKIVYSAKFGKNYTLAVYDIATGKSSTFGLNAAGDWLRPSWAPDSRHVVCSRTLNYKSDLYIVDTWNGRAEKLLASKMNLTSPDWSELY